jgi:hypothetical protein
MEPGKVACWLARSLGRFEQSMTVKAKLLLYYLPACLIQLLSFHEYIALLTRLFFIVVCCLSGDMVLYESHSVIHGRPFPLKGKFYANIFIHFEVS